MSPKSKSPSAPAPVEQHSANGGLLASTFRQQLGAMLVRNVRLKLRDSRKTAAEIFLPVYTLSTLILLRLLIPNPNFAAVLRPPGDPAVPVTPFEHWPLGGNHTVAVLAATTAAATGANGTAPTTIAATREFLVAVNELWTNLTWGLDVHEHRRQKLEWHSERWEMGDFDDDWIDADGDNDDGLQGEVDAEARHRRRRKQQRRPPAPLPIRWMIFESLDELLAAYWREPAAIPLAVVFHGADPMRGRLSYEVITQIVIYTNTSWLICCGLLLSFMWLGLMLSQYLKHKFIEYFSDYYNIEIIKIKCIMTFS